MSAILRTLTSAALCFVAESCPAQADTFRDAETLFSRCFVGFAGTRHSSLSAPVFPQRFALRQKCLLRVSDMRKN